MEILIWLFVLAFGASFGAFANVLIYRIPRNLSIFIPNSFCPKCKTPLSWSDKIPLFSFLLLKTKCRYCNSRIPTFYFLSELFGGLLALFCYAYFFTTPSALALFFLVLVFYALSAIDVHFLAIPDSLNFLALALSLIFAFFYYNELWISCIICLSFIGFATFLRLFVSFLVGKETLGEGDLLLFGTIGCALGVFYGAMAIFISALYALVFLLVMRLFWGYKNIAIPFIPFLFLGFLSAFAWQIV
ncbi:prepilin peptidase [Helicobacter turcicus]|uniref:Prepilin peptidase n=1 Tax=Helicobacter turcicus TaxID=2867412 RepID=A0ABS7JLJ6_9HELI|nr:A24 family peptidase [Helicobacter turcicus]MBX7490272.1 prepilin peptidase [Helicobacter turcicus]MBX7545149.1 prepilin peptidase [Helicobacter turcicus]